MPPDQLLVLCRQSRLPLTLLGAVFTAALLVPVLGLIAPTAMASASAHLIYRAARQRAFQATEAQRGAAGAASDSLPALVL
ncbi:MAG: hypothetical protein C4K60_18485 [Ideonella sp. MAG2]|nr:MAG: hypothetical protein C4K60_18485 [Ideonella sp. MAG2]